MDYKDIIDFLAISVPEQFLMAFFVWILLGRRIKDELKKVFIVGISAAGIFRVVQFLFSGDFYLSSLFQLVLFTILILFIYKLKLFESIVCSLITFVVFSTVQSTTVILIRSILGVSEQVFYDEIVLRFAFIVPELFLVSIIIFVLHKKNINFNYLKSKKLDKSQLGKIRFVSLQLAFAFFILLVIYVMLFKKIEYFSSTFDKMLLITSFFITIIFTVIVVKSAFMMNESIQKEEALKRQLDGRELIQNIDYLCSLIDVKEYGELKKVLETIRKDINSGMINVDKGSSKADHRNTN